LSDALGDIGEGLIFCAFIGTYLVLIWNLESLNEFLQNDIQLVQESPGLRSTIARSRRVNNFIHEGEERLYSHILESGAPHFPLNMIEHGDTTWLVSGMMHLAKLPYLKAWQQFLGELVRETFFVGNSRTRSCRMPPHSLQQP
jgi:hypothetical protein